MTCASRSRRVRRISHMGPKSGSRARVPANFCKRITTKNVASSSTRKVQYCRACPNGGRAASTDDVLVYRFNGEKYMLCVNAGKRGQRLGAIYAGGEAFGPARGRGVGERPLRRPLQLCRAGTRLAMKIVQQMCPNRSRHGVLHFQTYQGGSCDVILSTTGYNGSGGCEIYKCITRMPTAFWEALWKGRRA